MSFFPMCVDLQGKTVFLIGKGRQIQSKKEKLAPFGAVLIAKENLTEKDLLLKPAFVVVGDTVLQEAERISSLCQQHGVPVNVVDVPQLCTFFFPALITQGNLTVSVSTGGKSPAAAAYLRRQIEEHLPDRTEELLEWIGANRKQLREMGILREAVAAAFSQNCPLTDTQLDVLRSRQQNGRFCASQKDILMLES